MIIVKTIRTTECIHPSNGTTSICHEGSYFLWSGGTIDTAKTNGPTLQYCIVQNSVGEPIYIENGDLLAHSINAQYRNTPDGSKISDCIVEFDGKEFQFAIGEGLSFLRDTYDNWDDYEIMSIKEDKMFFEHRDRGIFELKYDMIIFGLLTNTVKYSISTLETHSEQEYCPQCRSTNICYVNCGNFCNNCQNRNW